MIVIGQLAVLYAILLVVMVENATSILRSFFKTLWVLLVYEKSEKQAVQPADERADLNL